MCVRGVGVRFAGGTPGAVDRRWIVIPGWYPRLVGRLIRQ